MRRWSPCHRAVDRRGLRPPFIVPVEVSCVWASRVACEFYLVCPSLEKVKSSAQLPTALSLPCAAVGAAMQACATLVAPMMVRLPHVVPVVHLVVPCRRSSLDAANKSHTFGRGGAGPPRRDLSCPLVPLSRMMLGFSSRPLPHHRFVGGGRSRRARCLVDDVLPG